MELNQDTLDLLKRLDERSEATHSRMEKLETAIIGNEELGHAGLVKRVKAVEEGHDKLLGKQRNTEKKIMIFGAATTGAALGLKGLWDKFINLF